MLNKGDFAGGISTGITGKHPTGMPGGMLN